MSPTTARSVGEITVNTRYLVRGDHPEGANEAVLQEAWTKMSDDAQTNGVEVITLDKFLNQIGYAPDDRVVHLGAGRADVGLPGPTGNRSGRRPRRSSQFRPRSPNRHRTDRRPLPSRNYFRFSP